MKEIEIKARLTPGQRLTDWTGRLATAHPAIWIPLGAALVAAVAAWFKRLVDAVLVIRVADNLQIPAEYIPAPRLGALTYISLAVATIGLVTWLIAIPLRRIANSATLAFIAFGLYAAMAMALSITAAADADPKKYSQTATGLYVFSLFVALGVLLFLAGRASRSGRRRERAETPGSARRQRLRRPIRWAARKIAREWKRGDDPVATSWGIIGLLVAMITFLIVYLVVGVLALILLIATPASGTQEFFALASSSETEPSLVFIKGDRAAVRAVRMLPGGAYRLCGPTRMVPTENIELRVVHLDVDKVASGTC